MSRPLLEVDVEGTVGDLPIALSLRMSRAPLVIIGPNGAGKTSALMMVLGARAPDRGTVALEGIVLFDGDRGIDVPVEDRAIGFVPQRYALFPHLDVVGNVGYGLHGRPRVERRQRALAALRDLGVEGLATRRPDELSGGEAQRVALARALAGQPRALVLDEPLAALDASLRPEVRRFLANQVRALALPTIIVTHDRADAEAFDAEVLVIERGAVVQRGRISELQANPETDFVRQFTRGGPRP